MNGAAFLCATLNFLIPRGLWVTVIVVMLFSLLPSPFQPLLLSFYRRGKLQPSSLLGMTLPQKFFLHFYVVGTVFNSGLLLTLISCIYLRGSPLYGFNNSETWQAVYILLLFELHVVRRLYESMYVSKFGHHARLHILSYLLGLMYYILAPFSLLPRAMKLIHPSNPVLQQHGFHTNGNGIEGGNPSSLIKWNYWLGAAIIVWGWIHQYRCHYILASLRENDKAEEQNGQYKVPNGDWFEYVSCAHYLAEIVIYLGFLVATGGSNLNSWLLFLFVVINLSIAAGETHKWYRRTFKDYPLHRKAVIPYIY